jgi:cytosine deaminase
MSHDLAFYSRFLDIAFAEAQAGFAEGGVPVGAALFDAEGNLLGKGRNRRVQEDDPSIHGETDAFRKAGRVKGGYRDTIMATTLAPCWFCSGLIRQFNIGTVVVGESVNFHGGIDWLRDNGFTVVDLASEKCVAMMRDFIAKRPDLWNEDIGK